MSKGKRKTSRVTWLVVILFVVMGIVGFLPGDRDKNKGVSRPVLTTEQKEQIRSERECSDRISAWIMAKKFVIRELKSPSSAKFPSKADDHNYLGDCSHQIVGTVEAQNSFGAMLQSRFSVIMVYLQDEKKWRAIGLTIE